MSNEQELITKVKTETLTLTSVDVMPQTIDRMDETISNLNTVNDFGEKMANYLLCDALCLDADKVKERLSGRSINTPYAKKVALNVKKLYGLLYVKNVIKDDYKAVLLEGIANGYALSVMTEIVWALLSHSFGSSARVRSGLNPNTKLALTKPTMLNVEYFKLKYPNISDDFYSKVTNAFKLRLAKVTAKEKLQIEKNTLESVKSEQKRLEKIEKDLENERESLSFDQELFEANKEADTQKKINEEKDEKVKQLLSDLNKAENRNAVLLSERDSFDNRLKDKIDLVDTLKEQHSKALIAVVAKTKDKFQSKEARELEKIKTESKEESDKKDRSKEAIKEADSGSFSSKPIDEKDVQLEFLIEEKDRKDKEIAALEQANNAVLQAKVVQANELCKLREQLEQYNAADNAPLLINAELVDAKALLKALDFKTATTNSIKTFKSNMVKIFKSIDTLNKVTK